MKNSNNLIPKDLDNEFKTIQEATKLRDTAKTKWNSKRSLIMTKLKDWCDIGG